MILLLLALLFALPFPSRSRDWAGSIGYGMAVYFAALIAGGMALVMLRQAYGLPWLPYGLVAVAWIGRWHHCRSWRARLAGCPPMVRGAALLVIASVLVLALAEPAERLPMGWDSAFHALLAQKILVSGGLSQNWLPFTGIPLNYPPGTHLLLAGIAAAFRVPVFFAERQLQFALMVPSALLAGAVTARAFRSAAAGWFAGLGLAFWGGLGTAISFRMWGGYPTALGLLFFFALCRFALTGGVGRPGWIGAVLCWVALGMTHHLTVVIVGSVVAAFALRVWCVRRRREWVVLRRLMVTGATALIVFIPAGIAIFRGAGDFGSVNAFNFSEEAIFGWRELLTFSGALLLPGIAGCWLMRSCRRPGAVLLRCWLMVLAMIFLIDEYPYRLLLSHRIWGIESTVFPASRFLTAMALPLAGFTGAAAALLLRSRRQAMAVLSVMLTIGGVCRYGWAFRHEYQYDIAGVAEQILATVPDNAYLVVDLPRAGNTGWLSYLTWLPGTSTPIPASENRRIGCFGAAIFSMPDSPQAMAVRRAFVEAQGREAWLVTDRHGNLTVTPYRYQSQ